MKLQFILRIQRQKDEGSIYLHIHDGRLRGRRFRYATKISVDPKYCEWSKGSRPGRTRSFERVKFSGSLSPQGNQRLHLINEQLMKLKAAVENFEISRVREPRLDARELMTTLDEARGVEKTRVNPYVSTASSERAPNQPEFFTLWKQVIETTKNKDGLPIAAGTRKSKIASMVMFQNFCAACGISPTLETLDMEVYRAFDKYMDRPTKNAPLGQGPNTKGRHMKELKAFLRECHDRGYRVNDAYTKKSFKVIRVQVDNTFLREEDLKKLLDTNISPAINRHRDLFVAACYVGARYGDWHQIRASNVKAIDGVEMLRIDQQKTKNPIHVPLHHMVRELLFKHGGSFGKMISNTKFNLALKTIAEGAGLPNAAAIKTHTARRSFATNAYLQKMDVHQIMKFTGHKTEASFLRYLKLDGLDYAKEASAHTFFKPKETRRVASFGLGHPGVGATGLEGVNRF